MVQYKQPFWAIDVGIGDIGAMKRAQISKPACSMDDHPDIIPATSCGGRPTTDSEVALITLSPYDTGPLGSLLHQALSDQGLAAGIHPKNDLRYHEFQQLELDIIANFHKRLTKTAKVFVRRLDYCIPRSSTLCSTPVRKHRERRIGRSRRVLA